MAHPTDHGSGENRKTKIAVKNKARREKAKAKNSAEAYAGAKGNRAQAKNRIAAKRSRF
jgi:hypothetical protein